MSFGKQKDTKSERVYVRVEPCEKETLLEAANTAGLTLSSYLRKRALGYRITSRADQIKINALRNIHGEVRRLGGLAKQLHIGTGGIYSRETAGILQAQVRTLEAITEAVRTIVDDAEDD